MLNGIYLGMMESKFRMWLHKRGFCKWNNSITELKLNQKRECVICGKKQRMSCFGHSEKGLFYWMDEQNDYLTSCALMDGFKVIDRIDREVKANNEKDAMSILEDEIKLRNPKFSKLNLLSVCNEIGSKDHFVKLP